MKLSKKVLTIVALSTMALAVCILISGVFGVKIFKGFIFNCLLSLAIISLACGFAISSVGLYDKKRVISLVSLSLLGLSSILGLIAVWSKFKLPELYNDFTIIIAVTTIFFIIIVSTYIKLGKNQRLLQAITFGIITAIDLVIILSVFGVAVFKIDFFTEIFIAICLVAFALLCTLSILGKRMPSGEVSDTGDMIKISKAEYEKLIEQLKLLKEENEKLKLNQ